HNGKNLKELLSLGNGVSLWWFTLIAEKNTYKSDAINKLAQMDAIVEYIKANDIKKIVFACKSIKLKQVMNDYLNNNDIKIIFINYNNWFYGIRQNQYFILIGSIFTLFVHFINKMAVTMRIKGSLSKLRRNYIQNTAAKDSIMSMTYFPSIDVPSAKQGKYVNKYLQSFQESMEKEWKKVIWIFIYVKNNAISFSDAIRYAELFIKNGHVIYFIEEFNTLYLQLKSLVTLLINGAKFISAEKEIKRLYSFGEYNFYSLLRNDWYLSLIGPIGYSEILNYNLFKSVFKKFDIDKCLYLCEMHAWEKALIYARDTTKTRTRLFGYQSGAMPEMILNYFHTPLEVRPDVPYPIAVPDKIICNGRLNYDHMIKSGWTKDKVCIAEAVRYNHLKRYMSENLRKEKNLVLVGLSISPEEGSSILSVVYEALNNVGNIVVWIKAHPFLHIEDVFKLSGIDPEECSFHIKKEPVDELLSVARIAIVGESSVSIEAIALGCDVVIIDVPQWINMSLLKNTHASMVKRASCPVELKRVICEIIEQDYDAASRKAEAKNIIDTFFCLDYNSDVPERFLRILKDEPIL
ncbi:MAG: hypothetical protein HQK97_08025, partial [Nitrospirae bacterium]|nr:hypothetical protein [Nitrospirota bacterium]